MLSFKKFLLEEPCSY